MGSADRFVSATVDIGDVEAGLDAMQKRAHALGPAFRELKIPFKADQKDHGRRKSGPFGAWARRAPSTLAAYRASGKRRLPRPLGKLLSAITYAATTTGVSAESKVGWSDVHQDGGTVGRGSKIPARPFLWISRRLLDVAEDVFNRVMLTAFGGGK